jgi:hypothetical protein
MYSSADEVADGTFALAVGHHARGARVDAELVLERNAFHVVRLARRSVIPRKPLRHDEKRDPPYAFRRVGGAREHEVHDVFRHLVLAPGNEDLGAMNAVVITFSHCARAHRRKIGTRLRLGQVHGPRPLAAGEMGQVACLLLR